MVSRTGAVVSADRLGRSWVLGLTLVWLAAVGVGAGYFVAVFMPQARAAAIDGWRRDLEVRSGVREDAIELWLSRGFADVNVLAAFPSSRQALAGVQEAPAHLDTIFESFARTHHYWRVVLFDAALRPVARGGDPLDLDESCRDSARRALLEKTPQVAFHQHKTGPVAVAFAAPVAGMVEPRAVSGVVMAVADPNDWLYPFIARQPGPAPSAEVLLAARDGESLVYLSPLRFDPAPPTTVRASLRGSRLAMAAALAGTEGFGSFVDYRGIPVLASTRSLSQAPWGLVVKVDEADALAAYRRSVRSAAFAWVTVALLLGALSLALVQVQQWGHDMTLARVRARMVDELEAEVRNRTAELASANRELEAFSYSVSHDLRAPVRSMDGFARMLLEDYGERLDGEGRRRLGVIVSSARQMGQLIDDLLGFSRVGRRELQRARVDMRALARSVFADLAPDGGRPPIDFAVDPLPDAWGDPALLREVWANLLSNAVKFTATRERRVIRVTGRADGARTWYSVRDNGVGFDPQYAGKLFGVFQRLHSAQEFEGTGVGLALVQRIVHRHGGDVSAEGALREGATFSFSLPHKGAST